MRLYGRYQNNSLKLVQPCLSLSRVAYDTIITTTISSPSVETGGILIGYDKKPLTVEILYASLPGPKAYHSRTKFLRDTQYCSKVLRDYYDRFGTDYVGEWHSHVVPLRGLSSGDIGTLATIIFDPDYNFNAFSSIVAFLDKGEVELAGFIVTKGIIYQVKIDIRD